MDESEHEWINQPSGQILTHDPIHDSYYLPELIWRFVNKPEFQRLREIKQTANTCYVYIGAEHTRFSHCIGVAHLCLEFGIRIKSDHPNLLSNELILILGIAGLVHDIGHCAYSHLYDSHVIPALNPDDKFTHEQASYQIFRAMCQKYEDLTLTDYQQKLVGKLIFGSEDAVPEIFSDELKWTEWDIEHQFYYEILSNKRTGIDVDKFDYLKRDSHYTGVKTTFEPSRLFKFYYIDRVKKGDKIGYRLEYQPKANELIEVMWQSRTDLHRRVYQHRVVKCVDLMILEIILACKDYEIVEGVKLKDAHKHMDVYCKITDSYIKAIAEQVPKAKLILDRIKCRDLWKTVASIETEMELAFNFSDSNFIVTEARLRKNNRIYYIYYKGTGTCASANADASASADASTSAGDELWYDNLNSDFYRELITQASGAKITLRQH